MNPLVKSYLELWREWMQHDNARLGYPSKSSVFASGGINCFDDMEESADRVIIDAVNAVFKSWREVDKGYRCVAIEISLGMLPRVFTYRRVSYDDALEDAYVAMEMGLRKRGIL